MKNLVVELLKVDSKPKVIGVSQALHFLDTNLQVEVFNTSGSMVNSKCISKPNQTIKPSSGVYFVRITQLGQRQTTKVWVDP